VESHKLQAKRTVAAVRDVHERETDGIADQVVAMPSGIRSEHGGAPMQIGNLAPRTSERAASIEINYLQRMESFTRLAILATNMKSAVDQTLLRRLRFIVNFQFRAERTRIWQRALPAEIPTDALDFERLARFNLSGGNIYSIVLNAAFSAAQRGGPVTMPFMLSAARAELHKLEKQINEAEFRSVEPVRAKS
jgi:hypothetical protein